jgi:hypothetical protein
MTQKNNVTVVLTPELRLEQALAEAGIEDPATVIKLTVAGTLTKNDLDFITDKMRKNLKELDMSGAWVGEIDFAWTFGSCGFTSVILPDSLSIVGNSAFWGCAKLKSVIIPDSVTEIEGYAFYECRSLTTVVIPASVKKIGKRAFYSCYGLKSVVIPDTDIIIGVYAFEDCYCLRSVIIPDSVTKICSSAFHNPVRISPNHPVFATENGVLFNKDKTELIMYFKSLKRNYVIPDSVIKIGRFAFEYCNRLASVAIPDSVVEIKAFAFTGCRSLTSIFIPKSVKKIENDAFDASTSIIVHPDNPVYASENGKLKRKRKNRQPFTNH